MKAAAVVPILVAVQTLGAQAAPGLRSGAVFVTAAAGIGPAFGTDTSYQGAPGTVLRIGLGLRVWPGALEFSVLHEDNLDDVVHPIDSACIPNRPCPVNYRLDGMSLGAWLGNPVESAPAAGFQLGAGVYRVVGQHDERRKVSPATALGLHADGEAGLFTVDRYVVIVGARVLVLPRVHGEKLWMAPVELRVRF